MKDFDEYGSDIHGCGVRGIPLRMARVGEHSCCMYVRQVKNSLIVNEFVCTKLKGIGNQQSG